MMKAVSILFVFYSVFVFGQKDKELMTTANAQMNEHLFEQAILTYTQVMKMNPYCFECLYNRGIAQYKAEKYQEAVNDFSAAIALNNTYAPAYINRRLALIKCGKMDEALNDYYNNKMIIPPVEDKPVAVVEGESDNLSCLKIMDIVSFYDHHNYNVKALMRKCELPDPTFAADFEAFKSEVAANEASMQDSLVMLLSGKTADTSAAIMTQIAKYNLYIMSEWEKTKEISEEDVTLLFGFEQCGFLPLVEYALQHLDQEECRNALLFVASCYKPATREHSETIKDILIIFGLLEGYTLEVL